jgi:hypothetical protein
MNLIWFGYIARLSQLCGGGYFNRSNYFYLPSMGGGGVGTLCFGYTNNRNFIILSDDIFHLVSGSSFCAIVKYNAAHPYGIPHMIRRTQKKKICIKQVFCFVPKIYSMNN